MFVTAQFPNNKRPQFPLVRLAGIKCSACVQIEQCAEMREESLF